MSVCDDFPVGTLAKLKNPLPISAYEDPNHLVHTIKVDAKLKVVDYWHDASWIYQPIVKYNENNIILHAEWIEKFEEIPENYEEIFNRKRDENLRSMFSND